MNKFLSLVIGGYVNGYSIIRELHECNVENIWLFDYGSSLSRQSKKIRGYTSIEKNPESLKSALKNLHKEFDFIVIFPTDDLQLELLSEIYSEISEFCFLPFNKGNLASSLDKNVQYAFCEQLGVPYPRTLNVCNVEKISAIRGMQFPVLIKPNKREDLTRTVFRSLYLESETALTKNSLIIEKYLLDGINFLASEYIPGDDTNIYAYTGYRSKEGVIQNEWIGKKLTQFPDLFGVFSSASNEAPEIVREQGRALLEGMDLMGIAEPEFKFDSRDGKYKLMEINLRSMMWHRTGNLSGVNLQYTQWLDATGQRPSLQVQNFDPIVHFVYMKHEIINLLSRKNYVKHFMHNVFGGHRREFAIFDSNDLKPFLYDLSTLPRSLAGSWLKLLRKRFSKN